MGMALEVFRNVLAEEVRAMRRVYGRSFPSAWQEAQRNFEAEQAALVARVTASCALTPHKMDEQAVWQWHQARPGTSLQERCFGILKMLRYLDPEQREARLALAWSDKPLECDAAAMDGRVGLG